MRPRGRGRMAALTVNVDSLARVETGLRKFAAQVAIWRPFWARLARDLSEDTQSRWPLRRRSGRLRKSLVWHGDRLGPRGVFQASPDRLTFGSSVFYSRFHQHGTKQRAAHPLIHIDDQAHAEQLAAWLRARAAASGVEVE